MIWSRQNVYRDFRQWSLVDLRCKIDIKKGLFVCFHVDQCNKVEPLDTSLNFFILCRHMAEVVIDVGRIFVQSNTK